jgi:glycolate oxidase FAD binding subunit
MSPSQQWLPLTETIAPAEQAAAAEVLRAAAAARTAVYPLGGGTGVGFGLRPTRPGIGLALGNLRRVVDYPASDMTITVEAGLTWAELSNALAAQRQRLPVDVPHAAAATIGGAVAANPSGPRRFACGTLRDYVLGLTAVDGQGNVFASGGRVVKNAAGLNVHRLLIGSQGTLGVITQVTLMVRPMPEASAIVACDVPDLDAAERLLAGLAQGQTLPAAVELLAGLDWAEAPVFGRPAAGGVARLCVGFEGSAEEVPWMIGRLCDEWRPLGAGITAVAAGNEAQAAWQWLAAGEADVEVRVLPSRLIATWAALRDLDMDGSIQAHAGNGVLRLRLAPRLPQQFADLLRGGLRPAVARHGGRLSVLRCPADGPLSADDVWGPPGDGLRLARAIKDRFDPHGILNPGRLPYGDAASDA